MKALPSKKKIKSIILGVVAKEKPESVEKLKQIMIHYPGLIPVHPEATLQLLIELEGEDKLYFTRPARAKPHFVDLLFRI